MKIIIGKFILYLLIALSVIGLIYQNYSSYVDDTKFSPKGQLVDIGGYKLYAHLSGRGNPTVIFDAGMGDSSLVWNKVIPEISKIAKVFVYDRAGLGWSEESPLPRTSSNIVEELYLLLKNTKTKGPYILVGQSFGGLNMQLFAKKYPDEVSGLILVDSAHDNNIQRIPETSSLRKIVFKMGMWAAPIGIPRLYMSMSNPEEQAAKSTVKHQYTSLDEAAMYIDNMTFLRNTERDFGELPLTVIARNFPSAVLEQKESTSLRNIEWAKLQEELAQRSINSSLIFSENRQHSIHRNQPHIVIDVIKDMVSEIDSTVYWYNKT
jgi:pimeloyl-ACP methyl ester carboxylesterase